VSQSVAVFFPERGESRMEDFVGHEFWLIAAT
jgi:hypothetical protein